MNEIQTSGFAHIGNTTEDSLEIPLSQFAKDLTAQFEFLATTPFSSTEGTTTLKPSLEIPLPVSAIVDDLFNRVTLSRGDVLDQISDGLKHTGELQKAQRDRHVAKCQEVLDAATKDADAGWLGRIFKLIGQVFACVALAFSTAALVASGNVAAAVLTSVALAITIMDLASTISQMSGGPDISLAAGYAAIVEAAGAGKETVAAVKQWLGLGLQVAATILGVSAGVSAAAGAQQLQSAVVKALDAAQRAAQGLNSIASGAAGINQGFARKALQDATADEKSSRTFMQVLQGFYEKAAKDFQEAMADLDAVMTARLDMNDTIKRTNQICA